LPLVRSLTFDSHVYETVLHFNFAQLPIVIVIRRLQQPPQPPNPIRSTPHNDLVPEHSDRRLELSNLCGFGFSFAISQSQIPISSSAWLGCSLRAHLGLPRVGGDFSGALALVVGVQSRKVGVSVLEGLGSEAELGGFA